MFFMASVSTPYHPRNLYAEVNQYQRKYNNDRMELSVTKTVLDTHFHIY